MKSFIQFLKEVVPAKRGHGRTSYFEIGHPSLKHIKGKWESKHVELFTQEHGGKMLKTPQSSDTKTHADLTNISKEMAYREINDSKTQLEKKFNIKVTDFCYPFGRSNELIYSMTKNSSFLTATSMQRGRVNFQSDKYMLPRIPINHHTLPHLFLAKILTKYEDKK